MRKSKVESPKDLPSKPRAPVALTARKDKTFLQKWGQTVALLADVRLFAVELILLMLVLILGTLAQAQVGLYAAQTRFFESWYWLAGGLVPMPGMRLVLAFILVGLVIRLAREPLTLKRVPVWLVHAGVVLLLAGGFAANFQHTEGYVMLAEGETSNVLFQAPGGDTEAPPSQWKAATTLPFSLTLHTFTRTLYPGTDLAKQYQSDVIFKDADGHLSPAAIAMNQPLRHNGWAVYQASYWQDAKGREVSVLAVVQNKGRIFPYLSGFVVALGLLGVVVQRLGVLRRLLVVAVVASAALWPGVGTAQPQPTGAMPMEAFASIPILHNGRMKPMETFARDVALRLTGSASPNGQPAVVWMANLVFQPAALAGHPFIKVADPGTAGLLGLPWRTPHLYTLEELIPALQKQSELVMQLVAADETASTDKRLKVKGQEAELLAVYRRVQEVVTLGRTFSLVFPLFVVRDETLAATLGVQAGAPFDYMTLMAARPKYLPLLEAIPHKKTAQLSPADKDVLNLALRARMMADDRTSALLRVLPPLWGASGGEWVAPWPSYTSGLGGPQHLAALQVWKEAMQAWQTNRGVAFAHATQLLAQPPKGMEAVWPPRWKINLELLMNRFQPFALAMGLCLLAALGVAGATVKRAKPVLLPLASAAAVLGLFTLVGGIVARILILGRPPVATLYESVLFVTATTLAVGLGVALARREAGLLGLVALLGAGLLGVAHWQAGQGDTLGMLIAVLNTNFWLTTHVLSITGGYGLCLLLAGTAHTLLLRQAWARRRGQKIFTKAQEQAVLVLAILALLTTALGTVLGGVWADQSWGRFWGWDPKENGALLIVLWLIMLLHLRLAGWLKFPLFLVGCGGTTVVVALSWFGVNLLSVGLHSYGFTSGMAEGLGLFVLGQTAVLVALAWLTVKREN